MKTKYNTFLIDTDILTMNIKQSPLLKGEFKGQSKENFIRIEPLLKCHLS